MKKKNGWSRAFSLIELLISISIFSVISSAIYSIYINHYKNSIEQEAFFRMQENVRAAFFLMGKEIMETNFVSDLGDLSKVGIVKANPNFIEISKYLSNDNIDYLSFFLQNDENNDGISDSKCSNIKRNTKVLANNIYAVSFAYAFDLDSDKYAEVDYNKNIIWAFDNNDDGMLDSYIPYSDSNSDIYSLPQDVSFDKIVGVKIWILSCLKEKISSKDKVFIMGNKSVATKKGSFEKALFSTVIKLR